VLVGEFKEVTVTDPLTTLHVPVPATGALPASVNPGVLHCPMSAPASAVTARKLVSTTSSELLQLPLSIVHLNVVFVPAASPVTVLVGEFADVIAAPLAAPTIVHVPVPTPGVLPVRLKVPLLHWLMSMPAFGVVLAKTFRVTGEAALSQPPVF
jgi:hypothetical protein